MRKLVLLVLLLSIGSAYSCKLIEKGTEIGIELVAGTVEEMLIKNVNAQLEKISTSLSKEKFSKLDKNKDGKLTIDDFATEIRDKEGNVTRIVNINSLVAIGVQLGPEAVLDAEKRSSFGYLVLSLLVLIGLGWYRKSKIQL